MHVASPPTLPRKFAPQRPNDLLRRAREPREHKTRDEHRVVDGEEVGSALEDNCDTFGVDILVTQRAAKSPDRRKDEETCIAVRSCCS